MTEQEMWWSWITGPRKLIEAIFNTLHERNSIHVVCPPNFSWANEMRLLLERKLLAIDRRLVLIDAGMQDSRLKADRFLLERSGLNVAQLDDYKSHRESVMEFLSGFNELSETVFWIYNINSNQQSEWVKYWKEWSSSNISLVIESIEATTPLAESTKAGKNRLLYKVNTFITPSDTRLFIYMLSKEQTIHELFQRYVASALSNVCGSDSQTALILFHQMSVDQEDLLDSIKKALLIYPELHSIDSEYYVKHNDAIHLFRTGNKKELQASIFKAQLEVFFPLIEQKRIEFLEMHSTELSKHAPKFNALNEPIETVYDLDIGQVVKTVHGMSGLNPIKKSTAFTVLVELRDLRNKLAHSVLCNVSELRRIAQVHQS